MNKAAIAFACLFALAVIGCSSVGRTLGQTTTIHGEVRYFDGNGVPGVEVRVKGVYTAHFFGYPLIPNSVRLLVTEGSDSAGRFSCRVPIYDEYYIEVGEFAKPKSGYATVQLTAINDTVIIELK